MYVEKTQTDNDIKKSNISWQKLTGFDKASKTWAKSEMLYY